MFRILFALTLVASLATAAENPETRSEQSQSRARTILDIAVRAIGGEEALREVQTVRLDLQGNTWPRLQMTTPEAPFEAGTFHESLLFDLDTSRLRLETRTSGQGFDGHNVVVLKEGEGTNYDLRGRTITPIPGAQTSQQQFVQYYRRLPNLILRQALDRATSLRYLGEDQVDGRKHEVITFVMPDTQQVALYVDAKTGLVSKYDLIFTDPLVGEEASEILYDDYTTSGKLRIPRRWRVRQAGDVLSDYKVQAEFNPVITDKTFEVASAGFANVPAAPSNLEANVEKLADGVFVIQNVAGQNQHTLAVAFKDFILAVEAPGSSDGAESVIKKIKEAIPGKPIRYLAMTHHHGDHIGGLRSFIAEGATVVTTKNNRKVVETMAGAPQKDRLARNPRPVQFLFLEGGKRVITDGEQTVELIDIGPNPHAREMVIAYLPKERLVFQGDLFNVPSNDAPFGPPQASTLSFARSLQEKGLVVDRIAGVHGKTATIDQFRKATIVSSGAGANE